MPIIIYCNPGNSLFTTWSRGEIFAGGIGRPSGPPAYSLLYAADVW